MEGSRSSYRVTLEIDRQKEKRVKPMEETAVKSLMSFLAGTISSSATSSPAPLLALA